MENSTKKVFIIAGHGGKDTGSIGNGLVEKEINLKVALEVEEQLKLNYEVEVIMSRRNDIYLSPLETSKMARSINPDICWSIHHNFFGNADARGAEVIDGLESVDDKFSNTFLEEMEKIGMPKRKRFSKANKNGSEWYWAIRDLKDSDTYAIISEGGFLSNIEDAKLLNNDYFLDKEASAIVTSIVKNLNLKEKNKNEKNINSLLAFLSTLNLSVDDLLIAAKKYATESKNNENFATQNISVGVVNTDSLNLRNKPSINGDVIDILNKKEVVIISDASTINSSWIKVKTNKNREGYVYSKYINLPNNSDGKQVITTRQYGSTVSIVIGDSNDIMLPIIGTWGKLERLTDICTIEKNNRKLDIKYATNETYFQMGSGIETFGCLMIRYPGQDIAGFYTKASPDFTNFIKYKDGRKEFKRYIKDEELFKIQAECDYVINAACSLVSNGERFLDNTKFTGIDEKHPRTAKGYLKDGRPFMVCVDGRRVGERGITANELSNLCLELGAEYAWISDGGGSAEMVESTNDGKFKVVNKPTDGRERLIGVAMAIINI